MNYRIPLAEALETMVADARVPVMWQPYEGIFNVYQGAPRSDLIAIMESREATSGGVCRSGLFGQQSDFGIYLPMMQHGVSFPPRFGDLFIKTRREKRVPVHLILAYEAQAAREEANQPQPSEAEEYAADILLLTETAEEPKNQSN